jgi:predicted transcriptional regulator
MATDVIAGEDLMSDSENGTERAERISEAEHAVMEALWERSPLTAAEVCDKVCAERDWTMPTVKTLLSRLVGKNAVATEPDGRRFLYSPLIERSAYVGTESKRLVERLFGGRAAPLFAHLAEAEALSDEDIAEIEALLKELKS